MTYLNDELLNQIEIMEKSRSDFRNPQGGFNNLDELSKFYMIEKSRSDFRNPQGGFDNILEYYKNNKYESINRNICYFYWKIIYDDYDFFYSIS